MSKQTHWLEWVVLSTMEYSIYTVYIYQSMFDYYFSFFNREDSCKIWYETQKISTPLWQTCVKSASLWKQLSYCHITETYSPVSYLLFSVCPLPLILRQWFRLISSVHICILLYSPKTENASTLRFLHQIWRNVSFCHLHRNGSSAVNGCRQNVSVLMDYVLEF